MFEPAEISKLVSVLRPEWTTIGVYEPDAMSMDVAAIHQGYLRGFRAMGGNIITDAVVDYHLRFKHPNNTRAPAAIAAHHSGGIRASLKKGLSHHILWCITFERVAHGNYALCVRWVKVDLSVVRVYLNLFASWSVSRWSYLLRVSLAIWTHFQKNL